jgi:hypothetical protein
VTLPTMVPRGRDPDLQFPVERCPRGLWCRSRKHGICAKSDLENGGSGWGSKTLATKLEPTSLRRPNCRVQHRVPSPGGRTNPCSIGAILIGMAPKIVHSTT